MPTTQRHRKKKCRRPRYKTTTTKRKRGGTKELQQELAQNFQFLNDWVAAGQGQTVQYSALFGVSDIITIYLHSKYQNICPLVPLELKPELDFQEWYEAADPVSRPATLQEYKDLVDPHDHANWNIQKFLANLQLCLETGVQTIVVPLSLPEHLNMVIIKAQTREIVLFEPHGAQQLTPEVTPFMEDLTLQVNAFLKLQGVRQFTYVSPQRLCPRRRKGQGGKQPFSFYEGFQEMEEKYGVHMGDDDGGFCQLWSWFFAECVLANPDLTVQEVYRQAFDFLQQNDTRDFGKVIRGYFISINDTLRRMRLSIEKGVMEQFQGPRDLLLTFLKQEQLAKEQQPKIGFFNEIGPRKRKERPTG